MYLEIKNSSNQLISRIYNKLNHTGAVYWVEVELNTSTDATYSYIGIKNKAQSRTVYFPIGSSLVDKTYKYTLFTANDELTIPYYRYIPNYKYDGDTLIARTWDNRKDQPAISSKKFINWNTKANGSGTKYYAASSFDVTSSISSASNSKKVKLYAQWSNITNNTAYTTNWVGATTTSNVVGTTFTVLPGSGSRIDEYSRQIYDDSYSLGPATINSVNIVSTWPSPAIASYSGSVATANTEKPNGTVYWKLDLYDLGNHDNSIDIGYSLQAKYSRTDAYSTWVGNNFQLIFYKNSGRTQKVASREYTSSNTYHFTLSENGVYKYLGILASGNSKQQFAPLSEEYTINANDYNTQLVSKFTGSEGIITVPYPDADPTTGVATLTLYPSLIWDKGSGSDPKFSITENSLASFTTRSIDYSVRYDKNCYDDVTNMPTNGVKQYNSPYTISDLIPERDGYSFKGWNLGASEPTEDFPGIPMQPSDIIPATNNDGNYILYAQWKKEEYDYDSTLAGDDVIFLCHKKPQVTIAAKRYSLEEPDRVVLVQKPTLEDLPDENGTDKNFVSSTYRVKYRPEKRDDKSWSNTSDDVNCYDDRRDYSDPEYPSWVTKIDDPVLTNLNGLFRCDLKKNSGRTENLSLSIDEEWQLRSRIYDALGASSALTYKEGTKSLTSGSSTYTTLSDWSNIALLLKYVTKLLVHNPFIDEVLKETRGSKQLRQKQSPPETDFWQIREHTQDSKNDYNSLMTDVDENDKLIYSMLELRGKEPDDEHMIGGSVNGFTEAQIREYIIPGLVRELQKNESLVYDPSQVTSLIKMLYQINKDHWKVDQEYKELNEQKNYVGLTVGDMTSASQLDNNNKNGRILELDGERHSIDPTDWHKNWDTESDSLDNRVLDTDYQKVELNNFEGNNADGDPEEGYAQSTIDHISNYDISQLDIGDSLSDLVYILSRMLPRGYEIDWKNNPPDSDRAVTGAKADFNNPNASTSTIENLISTYWDSANDRFKDSAFTEWIPSTGKWTTPESNVSEYNDNLLADYSIVVKTDSVDPNNSYTNDFENNGCKATCMGLCTSGCYNTCVGGCNTACGKNCFYGCYTECASSCGEGCSSSCSGTCTGGCQGSCTGTCKGSCTSTCSGTCTGGCSGSCTGSCGLSCSAACEAKCKRGCNTTCTDSCTAACKNGCDNSCTTSCGSNCSGGCKTSCKGSCSGGCNTACGTTCNKNCASGCGSGCSNSCSTKCGSGCEGTCKGGCSSSCYNACTTQCKDTCKGTCSLGCSSGCSKGCYEQCTSKCNSNCKGNCGSGCKNGCTNYCSSSCGTTCSGKCNSACTETCKSNCGGSCTKNCKSQCTGACKGSCGDSCETTCFTTCSNACGKNCKSSCSAGCYNFCGGNCDAQCAGYCDEECSNNCIVSCKASCYSNCNSDCKGACTLNCYNNCSESCASGCAQTCSTSCTIRCSITCALVCKLVCSDACSACTATCTSTCNSSCKNGCGTTCTNDCGKACTATCVASCTSGCYKYCSGDCASSCFGNCGSSCGGTCTGGCAVNCNATCGEQCGGSCASNCGSNCKSGCKTTCTGTCGKNCYSACEAACSNTCGSNCSSGCVSGCKGTCGTSCSTTCGTACNSDCQGTCSGGCKTGCKSNCSSACSASCSGTCGGSCTGACLNTCTGDCTGKCTTTCTGSCTGSCEGSCEGNCGDSCSITCGGSCSSSCKDSCQTTCTGSAYKLSA